MRRLANGEEPPLRASELDSLETYLTLHGRSLGLLFEKPTLLHALVEARPAVKEGELREFLSERLARHKVPRSFEFVDVPLRDDAGKVRRSALRAERVGK